MWRQELHHGLLQLNMESSVPQRYIPWFARSSTWAHDRLGFVERVTKSWTFISVRALGRPLPWEFEKLPTRLNRSVKKLLAA